MTYNIREALETTLEFVGLHTNNGAPGNTEVITDPEKVRFIAETALAASGDAYDLVIKHAQALQEAEDKAWKSLAGYKFEMFGYWASKWVSLNHLDDVKRTNPWGDTLVVQAKYEAGRIERERLDALDAKEGA